MIPIVLINGPLGSGKTTLIHALLKTIIDPTTTLWLKTEFGSESIDEYILQDTNVQTESLTGGCICHVLLSELDDVLTTIESNQGVSLVIIETSGMSHPAPVVQEIERHPLFRVAHTALIVDTEHADGEQYPKPMQLPSGLSAPYDSIVFNKYPVDLTPQEEGEVEKRLDPWFDGVYSFVEKIFIKHNSNVEVDALATLLEEDIYQAQIGSPKEYGSMEQYDSEEIEDHEGDMHVLTSHYAADTIITRETVETYAESLPTDVIRFKGVFHTGEDSWEFYNWARGNGSWSPLSTSSGGQVALVISHDESFKREVV